MNLENYIILNPSGNTYFGPVASRFAYRLGLPKVHRLTETEKVYVFEVMPDASVVLRAGQESIEAAMPFMGENRVMVWHEGDPIPNQCGQFSYQPWTSLGMTEAEYWKARYLEARKEVHRETGN